MTREAGCGRGATGAAWMQDLLTALALVLVIEGITLALFPNKVRNLLSRLEEMPGEALRIGGLTAAVVGVFFVWLLRG